MTSPITLTAAEIIEQLNDLIETCKDGEYGFRACAEHTRAADLQAVLNQRAVDCRQAAQELQAQVTARGGKPDQGGSVSGAAHRGWVAVRSALSGYTDLAILEEAERGEDVALARYRATLEHLLPPDVKAVVERQYQGVKRNHDQIRTLRNRLKANA